MADGRRPRVWGRLLAVAVLALAANVVAFGAALGAADCHSTAQCRVFGAVLTVTAAGGWAALLAAVVGVAVLRRSGAARTTWPATAAVAVAALLVFAVPLYTAFKDGLSGVTADGRAERHAAAREEIVRVVDDTVAAIRPGLTPRVSMWPGTRERNDTGTCEREYYSVVVPTAGADLPALAEAAAAYWDGRGFAVRRVSGGAGPHVGAEHGSVSFSFIADGRADHARVYGMGPCLRVS